jgi:hypothetical protein
LFATAATVLLRHLGYQARLVSGFYASERNYVRAAGHLLLGSRDVHFWVELLDATGNWIPVEVAPGYRMRVPPIAWAERLAAALRLVQTWATDHSHLWFMSIGACLACWFWRNPLTDVVATMAWQLQHRLRPASAVGLTIRLLEQRATLAGSPRSRGRTLRAWFGSLAGRCKSATELDGFINAAETDLYSRTRLMDQERVAACRAAVRTLRRGVFKNPTQAPNANGDSIRARVSGLAFPRP